MNQLRVNMLIVLWLLLAPAALSDESAYSPLALPDETVPETLSLSITDSDRDRTIPLRVYLPPAEDEPTPAPVVLFSPSKPQLGDPGKAFGNVKIPWMLMTGTKDDSIISDASAESRLAVFPALPPGGKYELVLHNAEHSAFADRALPGDSEKRNPNHHRVILALSTAFWDAYLRGDEAARAWLDGDGPRSVLEEEDRWQKK